MVLAIGYGILHDQVTARLSLDYFTIGHPRLIDTESPTLLALFWGIAATWWVALPLGFLLATACRTGRRWPALGLRDLRPRLLWLLAAMGMAALVAGLAAWHWPHLLELRLPDSVREQMSPAARQRFVVAWAMHGTSYAVGLLGALVVVGVTLRHRISIAAPTDPPPSTRRRSRRPG